MVIDEVIDKFKYRYNSLEIWDLVGMRSFAPLEVNGI